MAGNTHLAMLKHLLSKAMCTPEERELGFCWPILIFWAWQKLKLEVSQQMIIWSWIVQPAYVVFTSYVLHIICHRLERSVLSFTACGWVSYLENASARMTGRQKSEKPPSRGWRLNTAKQWTEAVCNFHTVFQSVIYQSTHEHVKFIFQPVFFLSGLAALSLISLLQLDSSAMLHEFH